MATKCPQRLFMVFLLVITIIAASSVSVFAYRPVIQINSSDWNIESDFTVSGVYPSMTSDNYLPNPDFYKDSSLNGMTYFGSRNWEDDYPWVEAVATVVPRFPSDESMAFGDSLSSFDKVVFKIGQKLYVAFLQGFNDVYLNRQNYFMVDVAGCIGEVDYYEWTYPLSSWKFHSYIDYYGDVETEAFLTASGVQPCEIIWSTVDVYDFDSEEVIHEADSVPFEGTSYTVEYEVPISVFSGSLSFYLDSEDVSKLSFGSFAFLMNDFGFIYGMDSQLLSFSYQMTILQNEEYRGTTEFYSFTYDDRLDDPLDVGTSYIDSVFDVLDFNSDMSDELEFLFTYTFVSDGMHLYFPGTIEFVQFDSYENSMQHNEVMNAVNEASAFLSGEITSVKSDLAKEITDAAGSVNATISSSTTAINSKIDSATNTIGQKLEAVKDGITQKLSDVKDGITQKLNDVKEGITNGLNSVKEGINSKLGEVLSGIVGKLTEVKDNILEGIKSFFIPSDEVMDEIDDKWDELLSSRFGALYEVSAIVQQFANDLKNTSGSKNTIEFPKVTVRLVDTDFTFGGQTVQVIPDGFELLVTTLKGITSIVCTFLFVNVLRRKYDKLMGAV